MKYLGIPKSLQDKISIGFRNSNDNTIYKHNTDIIFFDDDGMEYITYGNTHDKTYQALHNAEEKWYNLMDNALDGLVQNAQYQYSYDEMIENIEANECQFDKECNVV